jgi:hypothetical protein
MFFDPFRGENDGSTAKSSHLKRGDSYVVSLQLYSSTPLFIRLQPKMACIYLKIQQVIVDLGINATLLRQMKTNSCKVGFSPIIGHCGHVDVGKLCLSSDASRIFTLSKSDQSRPIQSRRNQGALAPEHFVPVEPANSLR